jgi:hypothetical protein
MTTQTQAKVPAIKVTAFSRFRGSVDGVDCGCSNGHITEATALKCVSGRASAEHPATAVAFDRFHGSVDGAQCPGEYGHKTQAIALKCAQRSAGIKPAVTKKATKPAAAATTATKATAAKSAHHPESGLHSGSQGGARRS